jgi:hypothetical protein
MSSSILKRLLQKEDIILPFVKLVVDMIMLFLINLRTLDSIMSKKMRLYEFQFLQELNWTTAEISLAQVYQMCYIHLKGLNTMRTK